MSISPQNKLSEKSGWVEKRNHEEIFDLSEDEQEEEGRIIRGQKAVYKPSQEEWDNHMRSHVPFRRWCPFCMRGKCKSGAHQQSKKSEEEKEKEVAVLAFDYMFPKSEKSKELGIESLPILIGINRKLKWKSCNMVPEKGANPYAAAVMVRDRNGRIQQIGDQVRPRTGNLESDTNGEIRKTRRDRSDSRAITGGRTPKQWRCRKSSSDNRRANQAYALGTGRSI